MKDPAFLFYPGDYLRDTQCLSENSQVAYDRIMCEHMRNICISQQQLNFFTKRLNEAEKAELLFLLTETKEGFCIDWVVDSIKKRKAYSESRSKNRSAKKEEKASNTSTTYVPHMENEDVNENRIENRVKEKGLGKTIREDQTEEVFQALQIHFKISEVNQFNLFRELDSFCMILQSKKQIPEFIEQFPAYVKYKELAREKAHNFKGFIGTIENHYQDGGWCADNWQHKLENFKPNATGNKQSAVEKREQDSKNRREELARSFEERSRRENGGAGV